MNWYKKTSGSYWTKSQVFVDDGGNTYDISLLENLSKDLEIIDFPIDKLVKQLKEDVWSQGENKLSPIDVLKNKEKYKKDFKDIINCTLERPILIKESDLIIIDGFHRLCKAIIEKQKTIKAKLVNKELLDKSKIDNFV